MSVVKLAASTDRPIRRACSDCRFYQPDLDTFWGRAKREWFFDLSAMRLGYKLVPTATGHENAVCSAVSEHARLARRSFGACGVEGRLFDASDEAIGRRG